MSQEKAFHSDLSMDLVGLGGLSPWIAHNSASRGAMFTGHVGSSLSVKGRTKKRSSTGMDREYGKYTFSVKMPVNGAIVRVIQRYPKRPGAGCINENPQTIVIYEDVETKQIGCLDMRNFHSIHQQFGFKYVENKTAMDKLFRLNEIKKDTIFKDSPNVDEDGNYMIGIETNVAFLSIPAVIEDGVVASDEYVEKLTTKAYAVHVVKWGKNVYPLNLYAGYDDDNVYKPLPDIGERVRADGLLFGLRGHHELRSVVEMTRDALKEPDYIFDKLTYVEPNAKVIDIKVFYDPHGKTTTPVGMEEQAMKYARANSQFYSSLWDEYTRLKAARKDDLRISPQLQNLLVDAQADTGIYQGNRISKTHRMVPLDDFRIEVTLEYDMVPTIGYKITGFAGDKGILCDVIPKADMPVDSDGNVADVIMDPISTTKRTNIGRMYEQYINAASRDVSVRVRDMFGLDPKAPDEESVNRAIQNTSMVNEAFHYLLSYYATVSPKMHERITSAEYMQYFMDYQNKMHRQDPLGMLVQKELLTVEQAHLKAVLLEGVYLWIPTNNTISSPDIIRKVKQNFPPVHGPIVYRGKSGNISTTFEDVLIGSIYVLLLDKTGSGWAGVASAKLQHFGIPAKLTNNDKYSAPGRMQPVRYTGEAEGRSFAAVMGGAAAADILDQSNNPQVHKHISYNILTNDKPMAIKQIVDRDKFPRGSGRPIVFVKHQLECGGWKLVRREK